MKLKEKVSLHNYREDNIFIVLIKKSIHTNQTNLAVSGHGKRYLQT